MYKKFDYTVDKSTFKELPEFVDQVHKEGKKFVVIVVRMLFFFLRERERVCFIFDIQTNVRSTSGLRHWFKR